MGKRAGKRATQRRSWRFPRDDHGGYAAIALAPITLECWQFL